MRDDQISTEIRKHADFVALCVKAPRTANEVAELVGVSQSTARAWVRAFADEGLLRPGPARSNGRGHTAVWEWAA